MCIIDRSNSYENKEIKMLKNKIGLFTIFISCVCLIAPREVIRSILQPNIEQYVMCIPFFDPTI